MYNLLVSGNPDTWKRNTWELELSRCVREYTDEPITKLFGDLDGTAISKLKRLPCLFACESGNDFPVRYGVLRDIKKRQGLVRIKYEFLSARPLLSESDFKELSLELDISKWEMNRTHWAVKDVNLAKELRDARGITLPPRTRAQSGSRSAARPNNTNDSRRIAQARVAKAMSVNAEAIVLEVAALSLLIDDKLEAVR